MLSSRREEIVMQVMVIEPPDEVLDPEFQSLIPRVSEDSQGWRKAKSISYIHFLQKFILILNDNQKV